MKLLLKVFLLALVISGCKRSGENKLFQLVSNTGINFNNRLTENDSMNILELEYFYRGGGVAIGDLNNDRYPDVILGGNMVPTRVYLNQGNLKFRDITQSSGLFTVQWINGISLVDINEDGLLDIYLCSGGSNLPALRKNLFLICTGLNEEGEPAYRDMAADLGVDSDRSSTQAAFLDYDLDQDLDMILINTDASNKNPNVITEILADGSAANSDQFFENQLSETGTLSFKEVSLAAGIRFEGFSLGVSVSDFNYDGWPDIYIANDHISNDVLYINQGNKTFINCIDVAIKNQSYYSMGVVTKDFTNDGYNDIFTLDMMPEVNERKQKMMMAMNLPRFLLSRDYQYQPQYMRNTLQINLGFDQDGLPEFAEMGQLTGIHNTDWSWGAVAADFNLDSRNDIIVANGYARDITNLDFVYYKRTMGYFAENLAGKDYKEAMQSQPPIRLSNYAFANQGKVQFKDVTTSWGLDGPNLSNGIAYGDLDLDGDLDLVINHINQQASVYRNNSDLEKNHYLKILPVKASGNYCSGVKSYLYHDGQVQYQELYPVQGYQSAQEPVIHYGVRHNNLDSLVLIWPGGSKSRIIKPVTDTLYLVTQPETAVISDPGGLHFNLAARNFQYQGPLFNKCDFMIPWVHQPETPFQDLYRQPLQMQTYSKESPSIAVADVDGNGLDDFYICSGPEQQGTVLFQVNTGEFKPISFPKGGFFNDTGAAWVDVNLDGKLDLFVTTGSVSFFEGHQNLQDRLYLNTGSGFNYAPELLPEMRTFTSEIVAFDYDQDSDHDLLVFGRVVNGKYPQSPKSYFLKNENGEFKDLTDEVLPGQGHLGLVVAAASADLDKDGRYEIIFAGEWQPIRLMKFVNGRFVLSDLPAVAGLKGWWQTLAIADLNRDGYDDILAGNFGTNHAFAENLPLHLYQADLDGDSFYNPLLAWNSLDQNGERKLFPLAQKDQLTNQIPYLKRLYQTYEDFARVDMLQLLAVAPNPPAAELEINHLNSFILINDQEGDFRLIDLPLSAQLGPVNAFVVYDFNQDGWPDLVGGGNNEKLEVSLGWNNNSKGFYLQGGPDGFKEVPNAASNLFLNERVKDLVKINDRQLLVAAYDDTLKVLSW